MKELTETQPAGMLGSVEKKGCDNESTAACLKRYKVTIAGEHYFLVSDEPEERIKAVARLVDTKIQAVTHPSRNEDSKRGATLIALQHASTLLTIQERAEKLIADITEALSLFSA